MIASVLKQNGLYRLVDVDVDEELVGYIKGYQRIFNLGLNFFHTDELFTSFNNEKWCYCWNGCLKGLPPCAFCSLY